MIQGKKIIGVCLTQLADRTNSEMLDHMRIAAAANNSRLIVFNSFNSLYKPTEFAEGAAAVFDIINYDIIDCLIIIGESFPNRDCLEPIIARALRKNVPVVLTDGAHEDCISVLGDYTESYKMLIGHVLYHHGVSDTFFIGGNEHGDDVTALRLSCYKEVIEEYGLTFSYENVAYGQYWEGPVFKIIDYLHTVRDKMPDAIFCANDYMAMAACRKLEQLGYKVPDDVIVTGFDDVPPAEFYTPSISTCRKDIKRLAELAVAKAVVAVEGAYPSSSADTQMYSFVLRESCGCGGYAADRIRPLAENYFSMLDEYTNHENYIFSSLDHFFEVSDLAKLHELLSKYILGSSYILLNKNLLTTIMAEERTHAHRFTEELTLINSSHNRGVSYCEDENIRFKDMIPDPIGWIADESMFIITAIHVGSSVCGYYASRHHNMSTSAHKLNRLSKSINIAFNSLYTNIRQASMRSSLEKAALINPISELYNLKGITKWFNEFAADPANHRKTLAVSIYALPKYKYIYENYGIQSIENAIRFIGDALRLSTESNGIAAQISDDEFVIINIISENEDTSAIINHTTDTFFPMMSEYNSHSGIDYYIEVNAGCTVVNPGWYGKLSAFIKLASSEMYINRIRYSPDFIDNSKKKEGEKKDFTNVFGILIEQNLFSYHFQPIVDAHTGNVCAYEALMRTDKRIGMNPLEVLDAAEQCGRLYDVERATMFNVMERLSKDFDKFKGRNIFVNSIPGYFLTDTDNKIFGEKYTDFLRHFVVEITEQNSISDEELTTIKHLGCSDGNTPIAVDDYGTGHSNIVNLMRYSPQIVKIDRFLITDVDKDQNKQMFIKSTIDFARLNNMKVLAEGVETAEELKTVVSFGVDLIQGYYTGKPSPDPLDAIAANIREEILSSQPQITKTKKHA